MKMNINRSAAIVILFFHLVLSRPAMRRIVINNHEWQIPDEPGWEEAIRMVEPIQKQLASCRTPEECRQITEQMSAIFSQYPVSKNSLESTESGITDIFKTIFKWG